MHLINNKKNINLCCKLFGVSSIKSVFKLFSLPMIPTTIIISIVLFLIILLLLNNNLKIYKKLRLKYLFSIRNVQELHSKYDDDTKINLIIKNNNLQFTFRIILVISLLIGVFLYKTR